MTHIKSIITSRTGVYAAINSERDYQDSKFKDDPMHGATDHTLDEFILYIQQYALETAALTTHQNEVAALDHVRKIAALCVGCMERHGAPWRLLNHDF